ncbi:MAG TPA: NUDIX hydrolase [Nitrospiraceae bacterium]|nr:NUDIX hydrolase [Nitrospiraceae bacterium]
MKFCSDCGSSVSRRIPPGDLLSRFVCDTCQTIHYQNPKVVVGCIAEWDDHLLLCRRAIDPRIGFWTFPAGFMEQGESAEQAAARETLEEAQADVDITSLYAVFSLPHISQVYMIFRGAMRGPDYGAGSESLEAHLFPPDAIPWDRLAFPVIAEALRRYVNDKGRGVFDLHVGTVAPRKA